MPRAKIECVHEGRAVALHVERHSLRPSRVATPVHAWPTIFSSEPSGSSVGVATVRRSVKS